MGTFFYTRDGDLRPLRVCACIYAFIAVVTLIGSGWHSLRWIGWLLMALGFSAREVPQPGRSQWRSPARAQAPQTGGFNRNSAPYRRLAAPSTSRRAPRL